MTFLRTAAFLRTAGVAAVLFVSTEAWSAQCVNVTLRDENGISLKTETPVVGMIVPGIGPIVNQPLPPMTKVEPGLPAECPAELVAAVQGIFNESCLTEAARSAAATANNQPIESVNERCQELYRVLNSKK